MIKCNLSKILGEKRMHILELKRLTGLSYTTLSRLYHEKTTRIDFDTMDAICRVLEIQPGDLFEYIPEEKKETKQRR